MAFENATRTRLQRFVAEARTLLTEDFSRQLQQTYGMDPVSGEVSALESLKHLDDQRRETAQLLREIFEHYLAGETAKGKTAAKTVLDRMLREQAFTILNRLAALRMMEARGILIEAIGKGTQSQAFQLYQRVANGGLGETGEAYKHFLNSLFDLYSADLPALFDRFAPESRLFPREATLTRVLDLINDYEIAQLWPEDETIGWIYQYFNSQEERRAMRQASQAPRNSRELAVRNQFFTPRYVVEFLVDNTLGRLWFNWTGGQTALRDRCQYLLVKPDEQPEPAERLRDPRTIKLLDPACGSMHFGLYAFDLFQEIYREAWEREQTNGPDALDRTTGGSPDLKPLSETYADRDAFLRDVPRLIIERNIYGIDIDPRAAQIASLALWLRAQRAWHEAGAKAKDRPEVGQGHVVAAVAPPAEVELRKQFMDDLDPLDAELFEQTLFMLKGLPELGVLLQVEKELPALIRKVFGEHGPMFSKEDVAQWQKAEARLREALTDYARAARSTYQGRLFAEDALQGLRMIDHSREVFDVVVMNPPFGTTSSNSRQYIKDRYSKSQHDLSATFTERMFQVCSQDGFIGVLSNRTIYSLSRLKDFRRALIENSRIPVAGDLGSGVLDAMVEASATVFQRGAQNRERARFIRVTGADNKAETLMRGVRGDQSTAFFDVEIDNFLGSAIVEFCYWVPEGIQEIRANSKSLEEFGVEVRQGIATGDNFRFLRLMWEISPESMYRDWHPYSKGGEYSPYIYNMHLAVAWGEKWQKFFNGNTTVFSCLVTKNAYRYLDRPALTYPTRTASRFGPRVMPSGMIFDTKGSAIFHPSVKSTNDDASPLLTLCAVLNSRYCQALLDTYVGGADLASTYGEGTISRLPIDLEEATANLDPSVIESVLVDVARLGCHIEPNQHFASPWIFKSKSLKQNYQDFCAYQRATIEKYDSLQHSVSEAIEESLGLSASDTDFIKTEISKYGSGLPDCLQIPERREWFEGVASYLVGCAFRRWNVEKAGRNCGFSKGLFEPIPPFPPGAMGAEAEVEAGVCVLASDRNQGSCLALLIEEALNDIWQSQSDSVLSELLEELGVKSLDHYVDRHFFEYHYSAYSKSRRKAPIYWPLSTASGDYTLWLYYPALTDQTLYTAVNDFVEPKLQHLETELNALRRKGQDRTGAEEKAFEKLQTLQEELTDLRDTLLQLAPIYKPNHDDGVQITAAPLWRLFRHKPWQKVLKDTWEKLEAGDYDWAHLAMAYWPERVREKCKTDKSLAIAHDLEHLYEEPEEPASGARKRRGGRSSA